MNKVFYLIFLFVFSMECFAQRDVLPKVSDEFSQITEQFIDFDVIVKPDKDAPEWWAGAPSVVVDRQGIFWMACRMRTADAPRGLRGYEIRILKSADGVSFETVHHIKREQVPIDGFERPALLIDPVTSLFKLYGCGPDSNGVWGIFKFEDAESPDKFRPETAKRVIVPFAREYPRQITMTGYKDPVIIHSQGQYHCYVIGYVRQNERIFHFTSPDGETWQPVGHPNKSIMPLSGWHDFFIRPASVVPLGVGYLFAYEGSCAAWKDPVYNIGTGIGFTFDLHHIYDLTADSPFILSSTPGSFYTCRYSCWLIIKNEVWIYAETAKPNDSHEIRLFRIKMK